MDVQLTNREMYAENQSFSKTLTKQRLLNGLLMTSVAGVFIGFLSPFGMDSIPLYLSIIYWVFTCIVGFLIYLPFIHFGEALLSKQVKWHWLRFAISAFIASVVMSFVVPVINWLFFNIEVDYLTQFWSILPKSMVIGSMLTLVTITKDFIQHQQQQLAEAQETVSTSVADKGEAQLQQFMQQLPLDKRGELICLEMSDHYLKVHTDKGHHLLLLRFKDAITMLNEYSGLQTHRSWWVSIDAIKETKREGRKHILVMQNGIEVPISKTYIDDVKSKGILVS